MPEARSPLRIVLLLRSLGYIRLFDPVVRGLLARGHSVHLLNERSQYTEREAEWLAEMSDLAGFSWTLTTTLYEGPWSPMASVLRRFGDYLYFIDPRFIGPSSLVSRAEARAHSRLRRLMEVPFMRRPPVLRLFARLIDAAERSMPENAAFEKELRALAPDVLVVSPHLMPGGVHSEYIRFARRHGIPSCICVASWDNLSSKQQLREMPDRLVVWNSFQAEEAKRLHRVDGDRIVITGAPVFDQWFERPATPRETFCARVGLEPGTPYLLFVAGALFRGEVTEAEFVRDTWIPAIRGDERLADVQLLIRPHPRRVAQWAEVADNLGPHVAVWPRAEASMAMDEETRADYFDSMFHSAGVVGINTTAMIEAAIVGRPVLTVFHEAFTDSQAGAYHFNYLLDVGGGVVSGAETFDEHLDQLAAILAGEDPTAGRRENFVREFVRPHGLDSPAAPRVVAAIEGTAAIATVPESRSAAHLLPLRLGLKALMFVVRIRLARWQRANLPPGPDDERAL